MRKSANRINGGAAVSAAYLTDPFSTVPDIGTGTQWNNSRGKFDKINGNTDKITIDSSNRSVSVSKNLDFDHTADIISSSLRAGGGAVDREGNVPSPKFIARLRRAIEEKESYRQVSCLWCCSGKCNKIVYDKVGCMYDCALWSLFRLWCHFLFPCSYLQWRIGILVTYVCCLLNDI